MEQRSVEKSTETVLISNTYLIFFKVDIYFCIKLVIMKNILQKASLHQHCDIREK